MTLPLVFKSVILLRVAHQDFCRNEIHVQVKAGQGKDRDLVVVGKSSHPASIWRSLAFLGKYTNS